MKSFDRMILVVLLVLLVLLAAVVAAGNRAGLPAPQFVPENASVGARGPITLVFSEPVLVESIESRLKLDPVVSGRVTVLTDPGRRGYAVSFWPDQPLLPGQRYSLVLAAGVRSQSGLELRSPVTWEFTPRQAEILFLSPTERPELWQAVGDGTEPKQLTSTGGSLFDFEVSLDGSWIIYSVINQQGGIDLWQMNRWSGETQMLLPCQTDWCNNPVYSPDGTKIAYSRRKSGALPGEGPGVPRMWMLDLVQQSTDALYVDPNIGGFDPAWSPDGRFLAFFDGLSQGVRVLDLTSRTDFLLPSQMGVVGEWSPDSRRILFVDFVTTDAGPNVSIYEVEVESQQIRRVLDEDVNQVDYSVPAWASDGETLAVAVRFFSDGPGKQLWMLRQDGAQRQPITNNQLFTHASYHWDPAGTKLVYQRLEFGRSGTLPQVVVWDRLTDQSIVVAENAFLPLWVP
jgi:Tol biopolymer transport system component